MAGNQLQLRSAKPGVDYGPGVLTGEKYTQYTQLSG